MIYVTSTTIREIINDVDPRSDSKASGCTPQLYRFDTKTATANFVTRCALSRNSWEQKIQFVDYDLIVPEDEKESITSFDQLKKDYPEIINSDVKVNCTCPAYLFFGYKYIMTELDSALEGEGRFPSEKNPNLDGTVCKHLISIFKRFFV